MAMKDQLDQLGVGVVAVGNGSPMFAKKFAESIPFEGDIFIDEESLTYKAASLERLSLWATLKRFFFNGGARALWKSASDKYENADLQGDGQQTGGVFVVGPGEKSDILYSFKESEAAPDEMADNEAILEACRK
mmetsp:Transcript_148442/g.210832  ORF Transcript_148442/g.210832 Transcript_148442/m.210832 type:complete len:134 (-) Transcript_148442:258-659(-)